MKANDGTQWSRRGRCVAASLVVAGLFLSCSLLRTGRAQPKPDGSISASLEGQPEPDGGSSNAPLSESRGGERGMDELGPARKGLVPWSSKGPRAPLDDIERRRSKIPEYHPESDLVFFSHIHKTSGTSLSVLLSNIFPRTALVPTSHPSMGVKVPRLKGHDEDWWDRYQVMYGHNRPNATDVIGLPATKTPRLLLVVRNPLLHKASIFFESVCRFGLHLKNGTIDMEEATMARIESKARDPEQYSFCRDAELWVGSRQYVKIYRNFQANWLSYGAAEGHKCIEPDPEMNIWKTGARADADGACAALVEKGGDAAVWENYFKRTAEAAIRRLEGALWVGVTERMEESACLLFYTLGKQESEMPQYRLKEPRPISVWHQKAKEKVAAYDKADWRVFDAANDILDLRLWAAREHLKDAGDDERERLGGHCFDLLTTNYEAERGNV
eukprot:g5885.t1